MRIPVQFGGEAVELEVADERLVALRGGAASAAISDVPAAVAVALERPLAFPPLRQAVVPGDHVAIVLGEGVPHPADVLGSIVECLVAAGVQSRDIQIVQVQFGDNGRNRLTPDCLPPGIQLVEHDPHDRTQLSYLASTKSGLRVYLNREVVDADLVVLVGRVDFDPILEYRGTGSSLFPGLADSDAQQHFRRQISGPMSAKSRVAARHETDEVAWLLGVQFAVQVVVGHGNEVVAVIAGQCREVQQETERLLNNYWLRSASRQAELVIAAVSGEPGPQGFQQLGAVLDSARRLVQEGGRLVVLSSINGEPGTALKSCRGLQDLAKALTKIRHHPSGDSISTWQIAQACQHARVYLLSRLADELVEDLFMTPITTLAEVQRLIDQATSCMVLNDAQLAKVTVEGERD